MKNIWRALKTLALWGIGIVGIILALAVFFDSTQIIAKIFAAFLFIVSVYILPIISKILKLKIKNAYIVIAFLVASIGSMIIYGTEPEANIDDSTYYCTTDKLNVRNGGGKEFDIAFQIDKGDELTIITEGENWSEIECSKGKGFVANEFISKDDPSEDDNYDWIAYVIVAIIGLFSLFLKKSGTKRTNQATSFNSSSNINKNHFHLSVKNGKVILGKENSTMKKEVFNYFDAAIDCDLEESTNEKSRFLVVTTKGEVYLCQLTSTGKKKVFSPFVSYGNAFKARFASNETFIFNTEKGHFKGYFNSTRIDKL